MVLHVEDHADGHEAYVHAAFWKELRTLRIIPEVNTGAVEGQGSEEVVVVLGELCALLDVLDFLSVLEILALDTAIEVHVALDSEADAGGAGFELEHDGNGEGVASETAAELFRIAGDDVCDLAGLDLLVVVKEECVLLGVEAHGLVVYTDFNTEPFCGIHLEVQDIDEELFAAGSGKVVTLQEIVSESDVGCSIERDDA